MSIKAPAEGEKERGSQGGLDSNEGLHASQSKFLSAHKKVREVRNLIAERRKVFPIGTPT
jgi:hypothetical protein